MVSFDNIEVLNFIVATISMIFFIMQAWKMYKKEPFGAIYTILYLFGALFTPVILFNGLGGYKPKKYPVPSFLQLTFIDVMSTVAALILGVTSIVLSQKREIDAKNEQISRDVASPLFLEIEEIKDDFLGNMTTLIDRLFGNFTSIWTGFNKTNEKIIALDISNEIKNFYLQCNEYCKNLNAIYSSNVSIIKNELDAMLKSYTEIIVESKRQDFFKMKYLDSYGREHAINLSKFLIFNRNPISYLSSCFKDFDINNVSLIIYAKKHDKYIEIEYVGEYYMNMVDRIEKKFSEVKEIQKLRENRMKLIKDAERIMNTLREHIISV